MGLFWAIIIVGVAVLVLCAVMIARWAKRENVSQKFEQTRRENERHELYSLNKRIAGIRLLSFVGFIAATFAVMLLLKKSVSGFWLGVIMFGGLTLGYIANNRIVTSMWKCPACSARLPCWIGRSSLRPKIVDACESCSHVFYAAELVADTTWAPTDQQGKSC